MPRLAATLAILLMSVSAAAVATERDSTYAPSWNARKQAEILIASSPIEIILEYLPDSPFYDYSSGGDGGGGGCGSCGGSEPGSNGCSNGW